MKIKKNAAGPTGGAGTSFARTFAKRAVMWLYCHGYLSAEAVTRIFATIDLKGA